MLLQLAQPDARGRRATIGAAFAHTAHCWHTLSKWRHRGQQAARL